MAELLVEGGRSLKFTERQEQGQTLGAVISEGMAVSWVASE
ncbi:MAG TPA: hypothetical protein V6D18_14275 [Thermosynechococcaceae cyanobacterium]